MSPRDERMIQFRLQGIVMKNRLPDVGRSNGISTKNPAAVALGRLRAAKGDLAAVGSLGGLAARGKPRKRQLVERCPCKKYTLARAIKRGHRCSSANAVAGEANKSAKEQSE